MTKGRSGRPPDDPSAKEWNATAYHVVSEPQFAWGLRVLDRLSLDGDEHVLDAGCGSGRLTRELASRVRDGFVVGCDLSENMTRAAAQTLGKSASPVVCGDLTALPFRGAFDAVFSTATFHWIHDHDRLFAELRGAFRARGRLEAQCGGGPNLAAVHARADALASQPTFRAHFATWREPWHFATAEETEARLRRAGFANARCWLEGAPTTFPDAERYRAFIEAVVMRTYLAQIVDPERRAEFLERLVGAAAGDDPAFTLDYWRLNISATTM
ncbi:MAG TPA: class I SAM-dependent methyltransferase [Gemmatimonadaceae bacterium]|nr:class I SAM-dependent methyltransferase [Gemmatimonadaceae bacterium]